MLGPNTPLVFQDGTQFFNDVATQYVKHDYGLFILAPSGTGKTHYINQQQERDWIDGDELWVATNAHPNNAWWEAGDTAQSLREVDLMSDIMTHQATKQGFWVMGASNLWLRPDAVVLPDWEVHKSYIAHREQNNYDGGATTEKLQQVLDHRKRIEAHATSTPEAQHILDTTKASPVPIFQTIAEAVEFLTSNQ